MRAELSETGATLTREPDDPAISHASTTAFHLKRLLNLQGYAFRRLDPSRYGLTACRVGMWDRAQGIILWHERYQIDRGRDRHSAAIVLCALHARAWATR